MSHNSLDLVAGGTGEREEPDRSGRLPGNYGGGVARRHGTDEMEGMKRPLGGERDEAGRPPRPGSALIPVHGGYRNLRSFQVAQLAYDVRVRFCNRYIDRKSRTHDQMVQAARSGVQNIAEGSKDSATSKKIELKLTGIARGSLKELKLDYEDFLRQRGLRLWPAGDPRRKALVARRC